MQEKQQNRWKICNMEASRHGRGHWAHNATPVGGHVVPLGPTLCPSTSLIHGTPPTLHHHHPFHVGLSSGHDSLTVDPWAHCHPLGGHQLTLQPPIDQISTCAAMGADLERQLRPYDAKAVHRRAERCPH
jgi:hypothetical protein